MKTAWVRKRRHNLGPAHSRAVTVINYQDDLLEISIGHAAGADFKIELQQVVVAKLGLQLSKKPQTVRILARSPDFIGTHFDAYDPSRPTFAPEERFLPRLKEASQVLAAAAGGVLSLEAAL